MQRIWPKLFPSKHGSAGGAQTQTQASRSRRTLGTDTPRVVGTGNGVTMSSSRPRDVSGGMLAGYRGPGGTTLEDEEDFHFEDVEMQSSITSRHRDDPDRKDVIGGVMPVRMKGW